MKKLLLALGSIAAVAAPVASVVACGAPKAPAPIALDTTVVTKLLPRLKTAVMGIIPGITDDLIDDGTVSEDGDKLKAVFVINIPAHDEGGVKLPAGTADFIIEVTPAGDIDSATEDGKPVTGDNLDNLKEIVKDGTKDHSHDTLPKFTINPTRYGDSDVIAAAKITVPADITSTVYDDVLAYNGKVEAFKKAFDQEVADEAKQLINISMKLSITEDEYDAMKWGDKILDAQTIVDLGIPKSTADKLNHLISIGARIHVSMTGADMHGFIEGASGDDQIGWVHGTGSTGALATFTPNLKA